MVTIKVNGEDKQYSKGTVLEAIAKEAQKDFDAQILIAVKNDKIKELAKKVENDGDEIRFLTMRDKIGHATYVRSATLLLVKAVADVVGDIKKSKIKDYLYFIGILIVLILSIIIQVQKNDIIDT